MPASPTQAARNGWPSTCSRGRHVLAVAGTHGKTGTTSMLAWILEAAGRAPGFLVGGVPLNFGVSARLGDPRGAFVIEADEYDTAFFDKRSKFVHYRPRTAILNNLEFDHADIFDDLAAIERQFHHLVRDRAFQRPPGRQCTRRGAAAGAENGLLERGGAAFRRQEGRAGHAARARRAARLRRAARRPEGRARRTGSCSASTTSSTPSPRSAPPSTSASQPMLRPGRSARSATCGAASSCAARSPESRSTTISPTTPPPSARPSTGSAARSERHASSLRSNHARTP